MLKRHLALTLTTTALLLGASPFSAVLAEDGTPPAGAPAPEGPPPGEGPDGGKGKGAAMFEAADTDKDGSLTRDEMLNAHKNRVNEIFDKLDSDKNGSVTKEEMAKGRDEIREKMRERWKGREGKRGGLGGGDKPE